MNTSDLLSLDTFLISGLHDKFDFIIHSETLLLLFLKISFPIAAIHTQIILRIIIIVFFNKLRLKQPKLVAHIYTNEEQKAKQTQ